MLREDGGDVRGRGGAEAAAFPGRVRQVEGQGAVVRRAGSGLVSAVVIQKNNYKVFLGSKVLCALFCYLHPLPFLTLLLL